MSKLEQAIIESRRRLPEFGLSPEASRAGRIFKVKVGQRKLAAVANVERVLEQSADPELLKRVRSQMALTTAR